MHTIDDAMYEAMSKAMVIAYCIANARLIPPQKDLDEFNELNNRWRNASVKRSEDILPNRCREEGV